MDLFFDMGFARENAAQVRQFLADPSQEVRTVPLRYYERRGGKLDPELMETMLESRYPDVRLTLVYLTGNMSAEAVQDTLLDLLLDDETTIRQQSLREFVKRRMDGWEDILTASLDDENVFIQRHAIDLIMRTQMPGGQDALRRYLDSHTDSPLAPLIRIYLDDPSAVPQRKEAL